MRHKLYERVGRFRIEKPDLDALPDWFQQMMARVIVLRASYTLEHDGNEYIAISPEFAVIAFGAAPTFYRPIIEDGRFLRFEQ